MCENRPGQKLVSHGGLVEIEVAASKTKAPGSELDTRAKGADEANGAKELTRCEGWGASGV